MSKEISSIDWDKIWDEYNKALKTWISIFETFQETAISAQTMFNGLMINTIKASGISSMSQFAENWHESTREVGFKTSEKIVGRHKSVPVNQKGIIKTPRQAINDLINSGKIYSANTRILEVVSKILNDSDPNYDKTACGKLSMFINQVNQNHNLSSSQKTQLIEDAKAIKIDIGCRV